MDLLTVVVGVVVAIYGTSVVVDPRAVARLGRWTIGSDSGAVDGRRGDGPTVEGSVSGATTPETGDESGDGGAADGSVGPTADGEVYSGWRVFGALATAVGCYAVAVGTGFA